MDIPTTAGTGAELTKGAIISSREKKIKTGIRGEKITPVVAIVDPTYTYSLPINVTMEAGFDVFAHAIESYCSINANPFSEMLSEKAIKIVGETLPRLAKNLDDIEARKEICFASHLMGYNVKNVGNCLPHRLQYPIGAHTETSHGSGLIALYPAWIQQESIVEGEKIRNALDWLGCIPGEPKERMKMWMDSLGISRRLRDLGCTIAAEELANQVTGNIKSDKLSEVDDIILKIYQESM
jgi:alcohol dehydrogenase class IV